MTELLPAQTHMGRVSLDVGDLAGQTSFYRDVLLLDVLAENGPEVELGRAGQTLVKLRHRPDLPKGERRTAGLFHTALLHPDAETLATVLASVAMRHPELYTGSGDHLVSQAFYFTDPEGNGVELYHDRPRESWTWIHGQVAMDTLALDPARRSARVTREIADRLADKVWGLRILRGERSCSDEDAPLLVVSQFTLYGDVRKGRRPSWNAAAQNIFGYTPDEAVGQNISLIIPEDRLHEEVQIISKLRTGQSIDHFETVRRAKDYGYRCTLVEDGCATRDLPFKDGVIPAAVSSAAMRKAR